MGMTAQKVNDGSRSFDAQTPLGEIVDYIDGIKRLPKGHSLDLVSLLSEGHPLYAGRTANEVLKLRAYAMAALERTGLPDTAMPFIRESLESSLHPYAIAAAARALRELEEPSPQILELLFKSIFTIWRSDRPVSFVNYHVAWPQADPTTGLTEIFRTFAQFGTSADPVLPALERLAENTSNLSKQSLEELATCISAIVGDPKSCCEAPQMAASINSVSHGNSTATKWPPEHIELQDQDGKRLRWGEFFGRKPTVLAFFYSRCGNPQKCTRTILNLSLIQNEIEKMGLIGRVRIAAVSYDALFDTPPALRSYGNARGFRFSDDYRMFRVPEAFDKLMAVMELDVSFNQSQVSSHRIEMFVMDAKSTIVRSFVRLQSDPSLVVDTLLELAPDDPNS